MGLYETIYDSNISLRIITYNFFDIFFVFLLGWVWASQWFFGCLMESCNLTIGWISTNPWRTHSEHLTDVTTFDCKEKGLGIGLWESNGFWICSLTYSHIERHSPYQIFMPFDNTVSVFWHHFALWAIKTPVFIGTYDVVVIGWRSIQMVKPVAISFGTMYYWWTNTG